MKKNIVRFCAVSPPPPATGLFPCIQVTTESNTLQFVCHDVLFKKTEIPEMTKFMNGIAQMMRDPKNKEAGIVF